MLNIFKLGGVKRVFGHKSGIKLIFAVTLHPELLRTRATIIYLYVRARTLSVRESLCKRQ